jgi:putative flippase GtrA
MLSSNNAKILYYMRMIFDRKGITGIHVRFLRYLIVGGVGTVIYMGAVIMFVEKMMLKPVFGAALSMIFLIIYTYLVNRTWVFQTDIEHRKSIPRFIFAGIIGLLLNASIMFFTVEVVGWWYIWGLLTTVILVPPTNFLINYYWTFK